MKSIVGFCLFLLPVVGFCQSPQRLNSVVYPGGGSLALIDVSSKDDGAEAARLADHDIAAGYLFLILKSGISPVVYSGDSAFCKKFGVVYWEEGCTGPKYTCMEAYNKQVFEHLTALHQKTWRRTVRPDVVGYKQWRKKH